MAAALCMLARDRGEINIAYQMPLYPMLDDRDTPSSRDNHARNWNTKRNRKAWKRYLRSAYGTDLVPIYAAPARCKDYRGLPPCYTYVGDIEPFYCETLDYVRHLQEAGIDAHVDVYPDWFHAYDIFSRRRGWSGRHLRDLKNTSALLWSTILPRRKNDGKSGTYFQYIQPFRPTGRNGCLTFLWQRTWRKTITAGISACRE